MTGFLTIDGGILGKIAYLPWAFNAALLSQAFLYAGFIIKKYDVLAKITMPWYLAFVFVWLVSAFQGYFALTVPTSPNLLISVIGGVGASLCIIQISDRLSRYQGTPVINLLERYGRLSLIVLCFHLIDLNVVGLYGWTFSHINVIAGPLVATIVGIVYRVGFATFWMFIIPKVPILRMAFLPRRYLLK